MIGIVSNIWECLIVCIEQRVGRDSFALRERWQQILGLRDDVVQYSNVFFTKLVQETPPQLALQRTFVTVVWFFKASIILSGIGLRSASWRRHLEEGIRRKALY